MATSERYSKSLQFLASFLIIAISFGNEILTLGKTLGRNEQQQSPWKPLSSPSTEDWLKEENRVSTDKVRVNSNITENNSSNGFGVSKRFTIIRDNLAHGFGGRHCLENAMRLCDLTDLAALMPTSASPCSLVKDFQTCLNDITTLCLDPDIILLKTSLTSLMHGFHANGKCHQVPVLYQDAFLTGDEVEACKPEMTWACAQQLMEDLRGSLKSTCETVMDFRNCIRARTRGCQYLGARFLVDGSQGLVWSFKKASYCK